MMVVQRCLDYVGSLCFVLFFFFNDTATTEIYTLSLHDALPISRLVRLLAKQTGVASDRFPAVAEIHGNLGSSTCGKRRSEEHTSELQSPCNLVCRLLLEKKKKQSSAISGCVCLTYAKSLSPA